MLRLVLLSFLLFCMHALNAYTNNSGSPVASLPIENGCPLDAPTNLTIVATTYNSVTAQWNAVTGAVAYHVRVEDALTQQLYYDNTVTGLTNVCTPLPSGTQVVVKVAGVCSNNEPSAMMASEEASTDIIIELVINGYQSCPNSNWNTTQGPTDDFMVLFDDPYEGEILVNGQTMHSFNFSVELLNDNQGKAQIIKNVGNIDYVTTGPSGLNNNNNYGEVKFFAGSNIYARMKFELLLGNTQNVTAHVTNIPSNVTFKWRNCGNGAHSGSENQKREAAEETPSTNQTLSIQAAPNPFNDLLTFTAEAPTDTENILAELISLDGSVVKSMNYTNDTGMLIGSFPTSDLPSGTYILRVQTQDHVEFKRVVKCN